MNQYFIGRDGIRLVADPKEIEGVCQCARAILVEAMRDGSFQIRLVGRSAPGYIVTEATNEQAVSILAMTCKNALAQCTEQTGFMFESSVDNVTQWVMNKKEHQNA